jgi:hypothetical protein
MIRTALLSLLFFVAACGKTSVPTAPMVAASAVPSPHEPPSPPETTANEPCTRGFVEIHDGANVVRYEHGRELVPNRRGAEHAYVERVLHPNGENVFHIEALKEPHGRGGHASLTLLHFGEPETLPATYDAGYAEYMPPGRDGPREERRISSPHVQLTRWGGVGEWIEGTFRGDLYEGRFRVCRTADWDAGKK